MGFFKKIGRGIKKAFKKIGKAIKKTFQKVGKFVGKLGILGTIALGVLTGGLGIGSIFTNFGATLGKLGTTMGGPLGGILKGASWTIGKAAQFGQVVKGGFRTLTKGVTEFLGQTAKYIGNKIPGINIKGAPTDFLGKGGVWDRASTAVSKEFETFRGSIDGLFSMKSPTLEAGKQLAAEEALKRSNIETPTATPEELVDKPGEIAEIDKSVIESAGKMPKPSAEMEAFMQDGPGVLQGPPQPEGLLSPRTPVDPYSPPQVNLQAPAPELEAMAKYKGPLKPTAPTVEVGLDIAAPDLAAAASTKKSLLGGVWQNVKDTFSPEGITKSIQQIPGETVKSVGVNLLAGKIMPSEEVDIGSSGYATPFVRKNYADAESRGLAAMQEPLDDFGGSIVNPVGMDGIYGVESIYKTRLNNFLDNQRIQGIA